MHSKCFSKTPGPGYEGNGISVLPPFFDEICFVYIQVIVFNDFAEILFSDCCCSCHAGILLSENAESDAFCCFSYTLLNPFQAVKAGLAVFIFIFQNRMLQNHLGSSWLLHAKINGSFACWKSAETCQNRYDVTEGRCNPLIDVYGKFTYDCYYPAP